MLLRNARQDRAVFGEQGVAFARYRVFDGWVVIAGPSGAGGHAVNAPGFDGVYFNVRTGELHIVDNKAFAKVGNVGKATAIDPAVNLEQNLDRLITSVEAKSLEELPIRQEVLSRLRKARAAIRNGARLPARVRLIVTNFGGRSTGVTERLQQAGVDFVDAYGEAVPRPGTAQGPLSAGAPEVGVAPPGPAEAKDFTSGPAVAGEEPALRSQVISGQTTKHVPSGVPVSGEVGVVESAGRAGVVAERIGGFAGGVADALMPGPLDGAIMWLQYTSVYAENWQQGRERGWHDGFPVGFATGLVFTSRAHKFARDELVPLDVSVSVLSEVAGTTGSWEAGYTRGLFDGIRLCAVFTKEQRARLRDYGVRRLRAKQFHWDNESWFSKETVSELAQEIGPTLFKIVETAEKERDERNTRAMVMSDDRLYFAVPRVLD